ncbi:hypothetical protein BH23CHL3_BH23CHL3_06100 [soil metagenome]
MSIEFLVIGELKNDPGHFLLRGDDGQCYAYDVARDVIVPIEVDGSWVIDVIRDESVLIKADTHRVAS